MIESVNNERVKNIIKLKNAKYRDEEGLFIVEGPHLVKEAKMAGVLKEAYTIDDLLNQIHQEGILDISEVNLAILETSGTLAVFSKDMMVSLYQ